MPLLGETENSLFKNFRAEVSIFSGRRPARLKHANQYARQSIAMLRQQSATRERYEPPKR